MKFKHRSVFNQIKNNCSEKTKSQLSSFVFIKIIMNQIWTLVDDLDSILQNIYEETEND